MASKLRPLASWTTTGSSGCSAIEACSAWDWPTTPKVTIHPNRTRMGKLAFMGTSGLAGFYGRRIKPGGKPRARRDSGDRDVHGNRLWANHLAAVPNVGSKLRGWPLALPRHIDVAAGQHHDRWIDGRRSPECTPTTSGSVRLRGLPGECPDEPTARRRFECDTHVAGHGRSPHQRAPDRPMRAHNIGWGPRSGVPTVLTNRPKHKILSALLP